MPTTLPPVFQGACSVVQRDDGITSNDDLVVTAAFTVIGLAVTMALAAFFPQTADVVALALIVT